MPFKRRSAAQQPKKSSVTDDGGNNNSNTTRQEAEEEEQQQVQDVLSLEYFQRYDELFQLASKIESSQITLEQDTKAYNTVRNELDSLQKQLDINHTIAKEQIDRIELVTNHWFYGTTIIQPQLWFRGGCNGKINRAKVKLQKVQEESIPLLVEQIQQIETIQLPQLQEKLNQSQTNFNVCSTAVMTRNSMKEYVIQKYPSIQWIQYKQQEKQIQQQYNIYELQMKQLVQVLNEYQKVQTTYYQQAETILLQKSKSYLDRYEQLQYHEPIPPPIYNQTPPLIYPTTTTTTTTNPLEYWGTTHNSSTIVSSSDGTIIVTLQNTYRSRQNRITTKVLLTYDSSKNGESRRLLKTNIPCPNHCGYLISAWHGTYCCNACSSSRRGPSGEGGGGNRTGNTQPVAGRNGGGRGGRDRGTRREDRQARRRGGRHGGGGGGRQSPPALPRQAGAAQGPNNSTSIHHHKQQHGKRCDRIAISKQDGSQDLVNAWNKRLQEHYQEIEKQSKLAYETLMEGQKQLQLGNEVLEQAILSIPITIQERYLSLTNTLQMGRQQRSTYYSSISSSSSSSSILSDDDTSPARRKRKRRRQLEQTIEFMKQCQSLAHVEDTMIQQIILQLQTEEMDVLNQKLQGIMECLQQEENHIWNELRSRAFILIPSSSASSATGNASAVGAGAASTTTSIPTTTAATTTTPIDLESAPATSSSSSLSNAVTNTTTTTSTSTSTSMPNGSAVVQPSAPPMTMMEEDYEPQYQLSRQERPPPFAPHYRPTSSSLMTAEGCTTTMPSSLPTAIAEMSAAAAAAASQHDPTGTSTTTASSSSSMVIPMAHAILLDE